MPISAYVGTIIIKKCLMKKRFANKCKFSNRDINKIIFLLQKGFYLCEYMDDT